MPEETESYDSPTFSDYGYLDYSEPDYSSYAFDNVEKHIVQMIFDLDSLDDPFNCILPSGQVFEPASKSNPLKCLKKNRIIPPDKRSCSPVLGKGRFKITLPGHGSVKNEECGTFKLALQCPSECEEPKIINHNCGRITCPECYQKALSKMASRAGSRMENIIASWRLNGLNVGDLKHGVYSPPEGKYQESDFDSNDGIDRLRKEAVEAHKFLSNGDTGCSPIVHPWRECHLDGSTCDDPDCTLPHQWYFSPHVHLLYTGFLKESTQLYHSKNFQGSIFKRFKDKKKRDAISTIQYQLSHCAVPFSEDLKVNPYSDLFGSRSPDWYSLLEKKDPEYLSKVTGQLIRYYGIFANCKAGKTVIATQDRLVICPKCKSEILKYDFVDSFNQVCKSSVHEDPWFLRVNVYQWRVKINGKMLLGIRSAEIDDEPYGFLLSTTERQRMEASVPLDLPDPAGSLEIPVLHYRRDSNVDSNWPAFNYYEY